MDFSLAGEQLPISSFFTQRGSQSKPTAKRKGDRADETEDAPSKRTKQKGQPPHPVRTPAASKENGHSRARSGPEKANVAVPPAATVRRDRNASEDVNVSSRPKDAGDHHYNAEASADHEPFLTPRDKGRRPIYAASTLPTPPPTLPASRTRTRAQPAESPSSTPPTGSASRISAEISIPSKPTSSSAPQIKAGTDDSHSSNIDSAVSPGSTQERDMSYRQQYHLLLYPPGWTPPADISIPSSQPQEDDLFPSSQRRDEPLSYSQDFYVPSSQSQELSGFKSPTVPREPSSPSQHHSQYEVIPSSQSQEREFVLPYEITCGRTKTSSSDIVPTSQHEELELCMPGRSQQAGDLWLLGIDRPAPRESPAPQNGLIVESPEPALSSRDRMKEQPAMDKRRVESPMGSRVPSPVRTRDNEAVSRNRSEDAVTAIHTEDGGDAEPSSPLTPLTPSSLAPSSPKHVSPLRPSSMPPPSLPPPVPMVSPIAGRTYTPYEQQASQNPSYHDISQRSCTPSQVRQFREMFEESHSWIPSQDDLSFGSQVNLEQLARGLPTGTQSQTAAYPLDQSEHSREIRIARNRASEMSPSNHDYHATDNRMSTQDNWLESRDYVEGASFSSDGSSIPPVVDDFLALFSQPGAHTDDVERYGDDD
ncbi:uncharacterized protein C8Q71DRAFT_730668 [Rhodofomes roseus]|uniref:Uncharacterized protein n=1 Tax=Rhodofomes roseus TaxID=34475 RepID=A0ABQ8KXC3_9APHY|nr:uncharacterized protein C8Q71DRAFT_730668 [Rhodofomes roseus]KAH9843949.1 hypothetical protein C8Q71DRAFT_730668 [Rhodofomes roseus]